MCYLISIESLEARASSVLAEARFEAISKKPRFNKMAKS